jgi:RNA recognition motif-containing protein
LHWLLAGKLKGYAFVGYLTRGEAARALQQFNGQQLNGRPIAVDWLVPKAQYAEQAQQKTVQVIMVVFKPCSSYTIICTHGKIAPALPIVIAMPCSCTFPSISVNQLHYGEHLVLPLGWHPSNVGCRIGTLMLLPRRGRNRGTAGMRT